MKRILLIDDEEIVVKSLEKFLRKHGYEITSVKSGQEAIETISSIEFDLIVTDIRMPTLNGIETLIEIRNLLKMKGRKTIPEICITGYADEETLKKAEQINVSDYLYKPFDLRDFLACVERKLKL